jgi:hypothetical protein
MNFFFKISLKSRSLFGAVQMHCFAFKNKNKKNQLAIIAILSAQRMVAEKDFSVN